jgi:hypothetical protein
MGQTKSQSKYLGALKLCALGMAIALTIPASRAATEVANAAQLRQALGLDSYLADPVAASRLSSLKIAVLDNGFLGFEPGRGQLPDSATLVPGPRNPEEPTPHGLGMAEIVWALTGKAAAGPHFYLVNSSGFTNFKAAIDFVIREHVDVVLYSQVWTFGGNQDGRGFIDAEVSRAIDAGLIWINAAGNFGGLTRGGPIAGHIQPQTRWLSFDLEAGSVGGGAVSASRDSLRFQNRLDDNSLTLTLSWSDFADDASVSTTEDLDLLVYDSQDHLVGSSELIQRGEAPPASDAGSRLSSYPREVVRLTGLDRGEYRVRIRAQSQNFRATDRFRLVMESDKPGSIQFIDRSVGGEILPPADHPGVITVGERFEASSTGPTADGRAKPDLLIDDAVVSFSNGSTVRGSSSAAAMVAGAVALMKSLRPSLSASRLREYVRGLEGAAATADDLRPADPQAWPPLPDALTTLVPEGGRLMIAPNGHFVVLTPVDALQLPAFARLHAFRAHPGDVLCLNLKQPERWNTLPPAVAADIPQPWVEFRDRVAATAAWRTPTPAELADWAI